MHDAILVGIGTALNDDPQLNSASDHIPRASFEFIPGHSATFAPATVRALLHIPSSTSGHSGHPPAFVTNMQAAQELYRRSGATTMGLWLKTGRSAAFGRME